MKILVISAHPDDETLGCGGTLLKHKEQGDALFWVIVTQVHEPQWSLQVAERKAGEVKRVAEAFGFEESFKLGFPTVRLDRVAMADLISHIHDALSESRPNVVYVVHGGDVHTDHRAVFTATMSVLKPVHMSRLGIRRVLCYESLSSTDAAPPMHERAFSPNIFNDITPYIERKIEIVGYYETETQPEPMPRSPSAIRALARYRGSTIGVEYAEAFNLIREVT